MVRTPHYYKNLINRADAQALYYRAVADQAKIPLIIYNWPQATGVDIPVEAVVAISEHPNVIAIKESSGNLEKVMQLIREVKHGFQVLVGSAPTLWPSLLMGASGAILAYANAAPYSVIAIWEAFRQREDAAGLDWQNRIGRASALVTSKYGVPGLKHAMDLNGYYGGPPRLAAVRAHAGGEARNRRGVQGPEGMNLTNKASQQPAAFLDTQRSRWRRNKSGHRPQESTFQRAWDDSGRWRASRPIRLRRQARRRTKASRPASRATRWFRCGGSACGAGA